MENRPNLRKIVSFFILSLLLHVVFISLKTRERKDNVSLIENKVPIKIVQIKQNEEKKQIVNTQKKSSEIPLADSFLGKENNKVDKETIARIKNKFQEGKGEEQSDGRTAKDQLSLASLGKVGKKRHKKKRTAQKRQVAASSSDYVKDIKLGDMTHLNTVRFKYFGFYDRIRQKLEQFWGVSLKEKVKLLHQKGKRPGRGETFVTSLRIVLNPMGRIEHIELMGKSGHKELDDAAIDSFNRAGPFPNPPKGLLKNGRAVLEWGFVVES